MYISIFKFLLVVTSFNFYIKFKNMYFEYILNKNLTLTAPFYQKTSEVLDAEKTKPVTKRRNSVLFDNVLV